MSDKLLSQYDSLAAGKLPVLDATLERFDMLAQKKSTTNQHLAELIRGDIGFTLAIFREVNSPVQEGRAPVQTVEHAISMLGVPKVQDLGKQLVPFSKLAKEARTALENIYSQSLHAAQYFEALAIQKSLPCIPENAKATKLMQLAQVAMWTNKKPEIESYQSKKTATLVGDQHLMLDRDMRALGKTLAEAWSLPEELQQALSDNFENSSIALAMTLADRIANETSRDWHSQYFHELVALWDHLSEAPAGRITNIIHQFAAETARQLQDRHLPQPAFFMLFPKQKKKNSVQNSAAKTSEKAQQGSKPGNAVASASDKVSPFQKTLTMYMKNMQQKAGVKRVLFAIMTPDRKQLKIRFVLGGNKDDDARQFNADLTKKTLFSLLMKKPQGIHLTRENQNKYLPLIPAAERASLNTDNLFAMSLFVQNKPVGLFIADSRESILSAEQYSYFKQLCQNAAKALEPQ